MLKTYNATQKKNTQLSKIMKIEVEGAIPFHSYSTPLTVKSIDMTYLSGPLIN